jgi:hypothetical protein
MKNLTKNLFSLLLLSVLSGHVLLAQGLNSFLTMDGLNHVINSSATSRAMGGVTLSIKNDIGLMFANPASLQSIDAIQVSFGGYRQYRTTNQTQIWFPNSNYSNFSLLMGGLTDTMTLPTIPQWVYDSLSVSDPAHTIDPLDSIQRQYDQIKPNWELTKNGNFPLQVFIAVPFSLKDIKFSAGLGSVEYANLNYYAQNNNVLEPNIGMLDPTPFGRPTGDGDDIAIPVWWSQMMKYRNGSIYGYGGVISAMVSQKISTGIGGMIVKGSTNDYEMKSARGLLWMHRTYFALRPYNYFSVLSGTSDYKGLEMTMSALYQTPNVIFGIAVKPPMTIERNYTGSLTEPDSTGLAVVTSVKSSDKIKLPWRGSLGAGITLTPKAFIKVEYEYLPMSSALFTASGRESEPWLDGYKFKSGLEYLANDWFVLRAGYCKQTEIFAAQNSYLSTEPVTSNVFSCGVGMKYLGAQLNLSYEYSKCSYEDMWATNININTDVRQAIVATVSYSIP